MPELRDELTRAGASEREAAELAALLARAAEPARFEVTRGEIEAALARARPQRRPFRVPRLALAAIVAAAAVLVVVLVLPGRQQDVQARALAAFGGDDTVVHLREEIVSRIPGSEQSTRDVWLDPARGRARWVLLGHDGSPYAYTLVAPHRFVRVLPQSSTRLVGASCRSFAAGCAELIDPVARYRDALAHVRTRAVRTTFAGRSTYRLILPLPGLLDQLVYVDTETFLPRMILWRERLSNGHVSVVTTIDVTDIERVARDDVPSGTFSLPPGGRVVHVALAGRRLATDKLTVDAARRLHPSWLGPSGLLEIEKRRYANGTVLVARYRDVEVWTYGRALPRELLTSRLVQVKTFPVNGVPVTLFPLGARIAVEREQRDRFVAVVGLGTKEELVARLLRARPLR